MRLHISYTALGLALVAAAPAAHAQTLVVPARTIVQPALQPVVQPMQTVQTTETIRTVRSAPARTVRRQVVTTRTVTRQVLPAPSVVARTVTTGPQPLYDEVTTAPIASGPDYSPPLYDAVVAPAPAVGAIPVAQPYTETFTYRYVYEPDRILVIDPTTNITVQAIPR